jgi:hypothetical protein
MIKQYVDGGGYLRHFAVRTSRPIIIREDKVIELNPATRDVINDNFAVQVKPTETIQKVNSLLGLIADEIVSLMSTGTRL